MSWRQVDCKSTFKLSRIWHFFFKSKARLADSSVIGHINNLYNTTFWTMVQQGGMSNTDAEQELKVPRTRRSIPIKENE
jgi:hypothetical protein